MYSGRRGSIAAEPGKLRMDAGAGLLVLLAVQFAAQPFLTKTCIPTGVLKSSLVLVTEIFKVCGCLALMTLEGNVREVFRQWTFRGFIIAAGIPSVTYLVQNFCIQIAYQELDAVVFNVLNQTKMLFTAFFVYVIARRGQSMVQCAALVLVTVSGILISVADANASSQQVSGRLRMGIGAMLLGGALSGFGAGVTERVLHTQQRNNYLLSAEMALVGCALVVFSLLLGLSPDAEVWSREGFFTNWDVWTFIPALTQSLGGILVGLITKVSGSVKKSFATICGIILTCMIKCAITGELPSPSACIAVPLAAASIYLHSNFPLAKAHPE